MYVYCVRYLLPENGEISADESGVKEMGTRDKEKGKKKRVKTEAKFKSKDGSKI
jgi:hypothetical protein